MVLQDGVRDFSRVLCGIPVKLHKSPQFFPPIERYDPMHSALHSFITNKINEASQFVLRHMPIHLETDEVYEDLIGNKEIAQAFANAVKYLAPNGLSKRMFLLFEEWGPIQINVRLQPTDKYPMFLLPQVSTMAANIPIPRESKLSQALQLPMRVARDWQMLRYVFSRLSNDVDDAQALACLMPWIRLLIAEMKADLPAVNHPSKDRRKIDQEIKAILSERMARKFPRMTEQLNQVCLSGKALFSQYRMLEACSSNPTISPIIIDPANGVPDWVATHMDEVLEDWKAEMAGITRQDGSDMIKWRP